MLAIYINPIVYKFSTTFHGHSQNGFISWLVDGGKVNQQSMKQKVVYGIVLE